MGDQEARYERFGIDVCVEVARLCMAIGTMAMAIEQQAIGAGAELVRMRRWTRTTMQAQGKRAGGWGHARVKARKRSRLLAGLSGLRVLGLMVRQASYLALGLGLGCDLGHEIGIEWALGLT